MTQPRPPAAVAAGDQMHARIMDLAERFLADFLAEADLPPLEEGARLGYELGVECAMRATLTAAIEFGWLKGVPGA